MPMLVRSFGSKYIPPRGMIVGLEVPHNSHFEVVKLCSISFFAGEVTIGVFAAIHTQNESQNYQSSN